MSIVNSCGSKEGDKNLLRVSIALTLYIMLGVASAYEQVGRLHIISEPKGAMAFLDGKYVGLTPLTVEGVAYGKHLLRLFKHGYRLWVSAIEVSATDVTIKVNLQQRQLGSISVTSIPPGANVFLNGVLMGKTPIALHGIEPGVYTLRLEREDFETWQQEVKVEEGKVASVEARLESRSEAYLVGLINSDPENVQAYYELAHLYMIRGRYDDALKILEAGMEACMSKKALTSDMRRLYQEIERIYTGQYKFGDEKVLNMLRPRILRLLEEGIKRAPRNHYNYTLLADFVDEPQKALELYEAALKVMKTQRARSYFEVLAASTLHRLAQRMLNKKDIKGAITLLEEVIQKYPNAYASKDALIELGSIYMDRLKDTAKAIETWRRFISLYPEDDRCPSILLRIADTLATSLKDYKGAVAEYRRYINDYPNMDDCPSVHLKIAQLYHQALKDLNAALKEYEAIVKTYPDWDRLSTVLKAMGDIWMQLNERAKAEEAYSELVRRFPRSFEAIYVDKDTDRKKRWQEAAKAYSEAYKLERENIKEALKRYEAIVKEFTDTYYAVASMQRVAYIHQYVLKDKERGIEAWRKFIQLFPDDDRCEDILFQIASTYASLKQYKEAAEAYRLFVKSYPKSDKCIHAQLFLTQIYSIGSGNYDRQKHIEESLKLMRSYPEYDGIPTVWLYLALNFYYQAYPGDKERAQQELLKLVQTYPYCSIRKTAEYYLDLIDAGLQHEENIAD
ncbi:MAG: PEGA domain-containing protein [Armatimonadetes bacterium]|nr:PEGA domain-containing protein [Armatimonadota bacterium]